MSLIIKKSALVVEFTPEEFEASLNKVLHDTKLLCVDIQYSATHNASFGNVQYTALVLFSNLKHE